jgi:preprotein translocase subunit SecY
MIPLIFAMALVILPGTIASYFVGSDGGGFAGFIYDLFSANSSFYWAMFGLMVVGFAFFYTMIMFQQQNLAETLQRQGAFVPGIRPGRPTASYFNRVITRITWGGALFLGLVAVSPFIMRHITGIQVLTISSMAILIMVGVALDTMRQLEAQLLMRRYEGFLK